MSALVLGVALVPFVSGLLGALMLAAVLAPLHRRLARVLPRRVAALAIVLGVLLVVLLPGVWLVTTAVDEAGDVIRAFQSSGALERLAHRRIGGVDVAQSIAGTASALVGWTSGRAIALFGSATRATLNLCVALFGLYYALLGGEALWRRAAHVAGIPRHTADILRDRFTAVTDALLVGTLLTAIVQGAVVGIAFRVVGLRAPVLWGVVTACVSVLPILGSAIVWLPGTAVLLLAHRYGAAAFLFALGAGLASNLDNAVRLVVFRRVSGIHPMLTLVGAFAGVRWLGIAGVLIGPLALSYFLELVRAYEEVLARAEPAVPNARRAAKNA